MDSSNFKVGHIYFNRKLLFPLFTLIILQVYLVTGGYDGVSRMLSTEIMKEGPFGWSDWSFVGSLPAAVTLLRGVSLDNRIIMTGNIILTLFRDHQNGLACMELSSSFNQEGHSANK